MPEVASGKEVEQHERCATVAVILRGVLHGAVWRSPGTDLWRVRSVDESLAGDLVCSGGKWKGIARMAWMKETGSRSMELKDGR